MKIVIAPNALKGSLTAKEAASAITHGVCKVHPNADVVTIPIADGGDGLLEVLQQALNASVVHHKVKGPLGDDIEAGYLFSKSQKTAIIEMATASGLALLSPEQLDPLQASTFGIGQLIMHAVAQGASTIIIGIGGSATNEGGMGMATALGIRFFDEEATELTGNGKNLKKIHRIDMSDFPPELNAIDFKVICDVDNPLLGANGATRIFGPQKGANEETQLQLENGLANLAERFRDDLSIDVLDLAGGGAAGGLGAGLKALLDAELLPGAELVLDLVGIDNALNNANLLITAEGQLDDQTAFGKAPAAVASRARRQGVPCIALAGAILSDTEILKECGIDAAFSLCPGPVTLDQAMVNAAQYLTNSAANAVSCFATGLSNNQTYSINNKTQPSMINKCIFPAAGYGTRFLPATKAMPKEMLPIVDKPLIQYGVEEAMAAGMTEIGIITGRSKRAVEDHFDISYELEHQISGTPKEKYLEGIRHIIEECTFSYTRQIEMLGLGHAILTAETLVGHDPFGVILADDLCINATGDGIMLQMLQVYEKYRCSVVAIEEVDEDEVHKYGVIDASQMDDNIFKVNGMVEKPAKEDAPSNLAIIGRYILTPEIFDIIRRTPAGKNGELQITDSLEIQAKENMVLALKFKGQRFDCGSVDGFVEATNHFHKLRED